MHDNWTSGSRDGLGRGASQRAAGRPAGVPGRSLFSLLSVSTWPLGALFHNPFPAASQSPTSRREARVRERMWRQPAYGGRP